MTDVGFNTKNTVQLYDLLSYIDDVAGMNSRAVYRFRTNTIAQLLTKWTDGRRFNTLIDIGCSHGHLTRKLKGIAKEIKAVDSDEKSLTKIQEDYIETIASSLPALSSLHLTDADVVVSFDTLYYLPHDDIEQSVTRIHSLLKPGGYFIINNNGRLDEIKELIAGKFRLTNVLVSPLSVNAKMNPDRLFWIIESRFRFCEALFKALEDKDWDIEKRFSEHRNRKMVKLCLKHRWLKHFIWIFAPLRAFARIFWGNQKFLHLFCMKKEPIEYLWVYQK